MTLFVYQTQATILVEKVIKKQLAKNSELYPPACLSVTVSVLKVLFTLMPLSCEWLVPQAFLTPSKSLKIKHIQREVKHLSNKDFN